MYLDQELIAGEKSPFLAVPRSLERIGAPFWHKTRADFLGFEEVRLERK